MGYHIFYFLLSGEYPDMCDKILLEGDPSKYFFINQGCLTVDSIDDKEEMRVMHECFHTLGFAEAEIDSVYKCSAAVVLWGEMKWKQRPREEQADADGTEEAEKTAHLMGINCGDMLKAILTPKVKVGNEFVAKGQNMDQVKFGVGAIAKSIFGRMFDWLVMKCNGTLDTKAKRQYFIGVLDIAGFEIFEFNTFEQLCINYTNERLQQFFNHHMFVLEQEEYKKEGIDWVFIDFGMDLQGCIDLIEKPLGILSILEEQCMFPKATDKTLIDMMYENHLGKNKFFGKPKTGKSAKYEAHFELYHYAGTVQYNIAGWLTKNKDPINSTIVECFSASVDQLVKTWFPVVVEEAGGGKKKGKKGGGGQTLSNTHKEQLKKLMVNLYSTHPHFVRCIIPNEVKTPGLIDAELVLHQLQCNGVLEGIRICRKGFPNRMMYSEFKQRYTILAPNVVPPGFPDGKDVSGKVLAEIKMDSNDYKLGNTKVFFRAGILGWLEDLRDDKLSSIISLFQSHIRGFMMRRGYQKLKDQRIGLTVIQRNIRAWMNMRNWQWWKLFTNVKPLLTASKAEDEMNEKIKQLEKIMEDQKKLEALKVQLEEQNSTLFMAKNDLVAELAVANDNLGEAEERIEQLVLAKGEADAAIKELEAKVEASEGDIEAQQEAKKKMDAALADLNKTIEDKNLEIDKVENEKKAKDGQIATLNDEMAKQDEAIAKLSKEKKAAEEQGGKLTEDLAAEEDKVNQLNKLKTKLEGNIDELEENLGKEKKAKADLDKVKKKLENDLRSTQENVDDLERIKGELEGNIKKKEGEINALNGKLEEEQGLVSQTQKKLKDALGRAEETEEELEAERQARSKVEKQRADLARELEELSERLDEAGGATAAQMDLNKKREAELVKLKRDMEELHLQNEQGMAGLKKKSNDAIADLSEQLDNMSKVKAKLDKEKKVLQSEFEDLQGQHEHISKAKANADKLAKSLEAQLGDANSKLDDAGRQLSELSSAHSKLSAENAAAGKALEEAESAANLLGKQKAALAKTLEETKASLEDESRVKGKLSADFRNLQADYGSLREQFEEEQEGRADLQRLYTKLQGEHAQLKQKFDSGEGGVSGEALDDLKRKLGAKLADAENQLEAATGKVSQLEKVKHRLSGELEDVVVEMERAQAVAAQAEKKQRGFDKAIDEWKRKVGDLSHELEGANADSRANATEVFRMKSQVEESHESVEALRRENKNLSDEIHDLTEQLGEGGRNVHELEKSRKRLEMEKEELQSALEEAEAALEQEEAKVVRASLEIVAIRQDIDKRLQEKDEEFDATRKNHQRALDSVQASLEAEVRGKSEALRLKKKLEQDINELEVALDGANRGRAEAEKNIKKVQGQLRELQQHIEEEQRAVAEARDAYGASERRANVLAGEIEELRTQLEAAERARKSAEGELHEASDRIAELSGSNASLAAAKRKLEMDVQAMQTDLEDQGNELRAADEQSKKAMGDAARLAEELRSEQEHSQHIEKMRKTLEAQVKELQARLDEAEASSMKGGKRMIQKLEQRVRELEVELDNEQRRHAETEKTMRKQDRRLKELAFQGDEDRKAQERMQDMIDKLQSKIKTYKNQVEEAEEIAAINLAKYRKVQHELEDAEERADMAENTLSKLRAKNRSSASTGAAPAPAE